MISEKVTPTQEKEVFMIYDHLQTGAKERPPSYEYNKIGEEFKAPWSKLRGTDFSILNIHFLGPHQLQEKQEHCPQYRTNINVVRDYNLWLDIPKSGITK